MITLVILIDRSYYTPQL